MTKKTIKRLFKSCLTEDQVEDDDDDDYDDEPFDESSMDNDVLVDFPIKSISNPPIYSSKSDSFTFFHFLPVPFF